MEIDVKQMVLALKVLAEEKNLPQETVQEALEQALATAWRRDHGQRDQNVRATINLNSGEVNIYVIYDVVEEVEDENCQLSLADAKQRQKSLKLGEQLEEHHLAKSFSRVAAQTAKQVILQRLREIERDIVMEEYQGKVGSVVNAVVVGVEAKLIRLDLGRARGIMPLSEQIQAEHYYPGQRLKVLLKEVEKGLRGLQLILSRGSPDFLASLFKAEVPEMENGSVEIKAIAREAGVRSKVAVASNLPNVDPVGTFVGGHGSRVQAVNSEVGEQEKIDIIVWAEETKDYITNALSPTEVLSVTITKAKADDKLASARVVVGHDQLSIAIGKAGQNVRLAGRLTGHEIDIVDETQVAKSQKPKLKRKEELEESLLETLDQTETSKTD